MPGTELTEWKPSFPFMEEVADILRKGREFGNKYEVKPWVPLLGGTGLGDMWIGRAPEGATRIAYDEPLTTGSGWTRKPHPDVTELGLLGLTAAEPAVGMARGVPAVARTVGKHALMPTPRSLAERGAVVWHGTPHVFNKFDPTKAGTGEGAQIYGHGAYLAGHQKTGQQYADVITGKKFDELMRVGGGRMDRNDPSHIAAVELDNFTNNDFLHPDEIRQYAIDELNTVLKAPRYLKNRGYSEDSIKAAINLLRERAALPKVEGPSPQLYKVDLPDPHIERMIDWDKPLERQFEVKDRIIGISNNPNAPTVRQSLDKFGELQASGWRKLGGAAFMNALPTRSNSFWDEARLAKDLAKELGEGGIPGVKYLDANSRGRVLGKPTSNYVVFPEFQKDLKILDRNGIPIDSWGP